VVASRDWDDLAANPKAFGEVEKKLYSTVEPILHELLDELKTNNRIETTSDQDLVPELEKNG
jgi:hypothetical protein